MNEVQKAELIELVKMGLSFDDFVTVLMVSGIDDPEKDFNEEQKGIIAHAYKTVATRYVLRKALVYGLTIFAVIGIVVMLLW